MGMTIDNSIENLVLLKKLEDSLGNISGDTNSQVSQALSFAIDTMRKYQKIQEQVELSEKENHKIDVARMIQIREFIYGNDN